MKHYSHKKLSKRTVFVFRSREEKKGTSTDPTETSLTIITVGTGVVPDGDLSSNKRLNPL
jgi:hypothetical protein